VGEANLKRIKTQKMDAKKSKFILFCYRVIFLVLVSYGIFYFSYKFYIPWPGDNDFAQYYPMYLHPLDFTQAEAPFIYRQFSAVITNVVYRTGIFYPNEIQFSNPAYDQRVFFSVLLSNYVALLLTAIVVGNMIIHITKSDSLLPPLMGGLLCFTAFFTQKGVITEMTEGWSWFLVAIGFYGYLRRSLWLILPVLFLSIFQKETIPIVFGVLAAIDLLASFWDKKVHLFYKWTFASSLLAFVGYLLVRTVLLPVGGEYESQLNAASMMANLTNLFTAGFSSTLFFQGVITQNTYLIFAFTTLIFFIFHSKRDLAPVTACRSPSVTACRSPHLLTQKSYFLQISCAMLLLDLVGIAAGIGNNIGRIAAILTPITATYIVVLMGAIEDDVKS
jgi:hypothetical protein